MHPYETYLGVDGQLHSVCTKAELLHDEKGLPYAWKIPPLPNVKLVARVPEANPMAIEEHPLRKAYLKVNAAIHHQIREKTRPQDVTYEEAKQMVVEALKGVGLPESEIATIVEKHVAKMV